MTDREKIMTGECVSPLTTDRCPVCIDHCEASDYKQKIDELLRVNSDPIEELSRIYEKCKDIIYATPGFTASPEEAELLKNIQFLRDVAAQNIQKINSGAWIKVGDDLPKRDEDVLACFTGWDDMEFTRVLEYDHDEKNWIDWRGDVYELVTHWKQINLPGE